MLAKKKKKIKEVKRLSYPKIAIFSALVVVLLITILLAEQPSTTPPLLSCSRLNNKIRCEWENCQFKTVENAELIIAKKPNYVEIYTILSSNGETLFSPPTIEGTYILLLTCENKEIIQQLVLS